MGKSFDAVMSYKTMTPGSIKKFESELSFGIIKAAVYENNFSDFMIQCTLAGVKWRKIVSDKFNSWLWSNGSTDILLKIAEMKQERKGGLMFNMRKLLYNILNCPTCSYNYATEEPIPNYELLETALSLYKNKYNGTADDVAELIKESRFVDRTYGGREGYLALNEYVPATVYEMFERIYPGSNLFPNPKGSWTNPMDGKTYKTFRFQSIEIVTEPVGDPIMFKDVSKPGVIPKGWRLPDPDEVRTAKDERALELKKLFVPERLGCVINDNNTYFFPTYGVYYSEEEGLVKENIWLSGIRTGESSLYWYDSVKNVLPGVKLDRYKASLIICRDV